MCVFSFSFLGTYSTNDATVAPAPVNRGFTGDEANLHFIHLKIFG
jgi:hypothetical protein